MKLVILCQEEPVFLGPFLREVIARAPDRVHTILLAGRRSAGERRGTVPELARSLRTFWLLFEPKGFVDALLRRARFTLLGTRDRNSVEGLAGQLGIPVRHVKGHRSADVLPLLRELQPDVVLNQSEILLNAEVLAAPTVGFVNRHASLLPLDRGRLGSFRGHAHDPPRYGITIHMVDEGIDTGSILLQWEATDVDPRWPFPRVLRHVNREAPALFWQAIDKIERGEEPEPQPPGDGTPPARFPTLEEVKAYRNLLAARRKR